METKLIDSFKIDHNVLKPGLYGRAPKHGVSTFDLRMCTPNKESISPSAMHSIEHCFATYFKTISKYSEEVVSFCPGACNTMFYLELVQDFNMPVYEEIWKAINYTLSLDKVPGREKSECGNYRQHNLESAKKWLLKYRDIIDSNINGCIYAEYVAGIS